MPRHFRAGSLLSVSTAMAAALLLVVPSAASAAPGSGSSVTGSAESGSSGSSDGPNIDPNNYAQDCPDVLMLAVTGATDSESDRDPLNEEPRSPLSNWVGNVTLPAGQASANNPGSVGWLYVPYASTYGVDILSDVPTYQDSVAEGIAATNRLLDEYKTKCGDATKFVLLGYSVGGEVIERVSMDIGHRDPDALVAGDDIAGVVMIGAPYRPAGVPNFDEPGPTNGGFQSQTPKDYGTLNDKVTWSCRPYDLACDAPDNIVALQLALGVLGQMRLTVLNPIQTLADFARTVASIATRAIVDIATNKNWLDSDETLLEVLLKVSDRLYEVDEQKAWAQLTPDQLLDDLNWAMGPGADKVREKLHREGVGLVENNKGIVDVAIGPYIFIGFLQHLLYWNNNPGDGREWESEKIVAWVTDLAQTEREKKNVDDAPLAPSEVDPAPEPDAQQLPEAAREPDPQALPTPGTRTRDSDLGAFLESLGIVPPGVFPPQYSTVPERTTDPSTDIVPETSQG
ncbi:cutinase family protein [Rhodococcus sp. P1Y]|uniref:cutinase family protein n=1 Tax=Rhodococcus sp. P1Y TaxID=1302308 RepID=UPI000EAC5302|nr:cutinase family protein [Rhodococcus sp. P1Y]AYJ51682.1 cutinase family protein [Rhodococcus sp. P1Y]